MIEFIIKYWVQALLGLIIGILSFICKKFYSLYQSEKQHLVVKEQTRLKNDLVETAAKVNEDSRQGDLELQQQINILKTGILSIQGRHFKQDCRELLQEGREITLEEFEAIEEDHNTYKSLGGNHDGDILFSMVLKKATNNLTENRES